MLRRLLLVLLVAGTVWITFAPALGFGLLNWEDRLVITENAALTQPGVTRWAFGTTYMEHYQPASWLLWSALGGAGLGVTVTLHAANLFLHVLVALLVTAVARTLFHRALPGHPPAVIDGAAAFAGVFYAVHPLRVEVVAWVSAMPYALGAALALAAVWIWLRAADRHARVSWIAIILFAASLAARPVALGLPVVLIALDRWLFGRRLRIGVIRAAPFLGLAAVAAAAELYARAPALAEIPWSYRLQLAFSAPFLYMRHTLWPIGLNPLDLLPRHPVGDARLTIAAAFGLLGVTVVAWMARRRVPAIFAGWISYLALLAPVAGLVPSGWPATADRYAYLPGVVLAMGGAGVGAAWAGRQGARRRVAALGALTLAVVSAIAARQVLATWADSLTLWTRVVTLDPANDVGLFNLAVTLAEQGQSDAAAERYRAVLAVNPQHAVARANLDRLDADRFEREANALAEAGQLSEAADRYRAALARDPRRAPSQAARGMALATLGRSAEAIPHLREALRLGIDDVAVANTLAGLLLETGATAEARTVLEAALAAHPQEVGLAHNLARLLLTLPTLPPEALARALELAESVVEATSSEDARALDTLAAALGAAGRLDEAREVNAKAAAVATAQGDTELAAQITARGREIGK